MRDLLVRPSAHVRAGRHVAPTGRAVRVERGRFDHRVAAGLDGVHQDEPVPHTVRYAVGDGRIDVILDGGETSSLWWATKNEWLGLIDVPGLEIESLFGGFAGEPSSKRAASTCS